MPMSHDEYEVFERLQEWVAKGQKLYDMYDKSRAYPVLPPERLDEARALYSEIKNGLKAEYRRTSNSREKVSPAEQRWYRAYVHEAFVRLREPTNARPEKWFSGVSEVISDFESVISSMEKTLDSDPD